MTHELLSVTEAIRWLDCQRLVSVEHAIHGLYAALDRTQILNLYHQYFPAEFAASTANANFHYHFGYTPREIEFMDLVSQNLFPLLDIAWIEEMENERYGFIPLDPCGFTEEDWDFENEDIRWPVRVFARILGWDGPDWSRVLLTLGIETPAPAEHINWDKFIRLCRRAGGVMAWVPAFASMVGNDTGNPWLDLTFEIACEYEYWEWTAENIEQLRKLWKMAQKMITQFGEVVDWLEEDPSRLNAVIALWNRSAAPKGEQKNCGGEGG